MLNQHESSICWKRQVRLGTLTMNCFRSSRGSLNHARHVRGTHDHHEDLQSVFHLLNNFWNVEISIDWFEAFSDDVSLVRLHTMNLTTVLRRNSHGVKEIRVHFEEAEALRCCCLLYYRYRYFWSAVKTITITVLRDSLQSFGTRQLREKFMTRNEVDRQTRIWAV